MGPFLGPIGGCPNKLIITIGYLLYNYDNPMFHNSNCQCNHNNMQSMYETTFLLLFLFKKSLFVISDLTEIVTKADSDPEVDKCQNQGCWSQGNPLQKAFYLSNKQINCPMLRFYLRLEKLSSERKTRNLNKKFQFVRQK